MNLNVSATHPPNHAEPHQPTAWIESRLFHRARVSRGTLSISIESRIGMTLLISVLRTRKSGAMTRQSSQRTTKARTTIVTRQPMPRNWAHSTHCTRPTATENRWAAVETAAIRSGRSV